MATGHQLSVVTNSCVKPPVDRKTGTPSTLLERKEEFLKNYPSGYIRDGVLLRSKTSVCDGHHKRQPLAKSVGLNGFGSANGFQGHGNIDEMHDLKKFSSDKDENEDRLSDDEYYKQLIKLKEEQRKTLALYEELYKEKSTGRRSPGVSQHVRREAHTAHRLSRSSSTNSMEDIERLFAETDPMSKNDSFKTNLKSKDNVKDLSSKPPTGKNLSTSGSFSNKFSTRSTGWSYDSDDFMRNITSNSFELSEDDAEVIDYRGAVYESDNGKADSTAAYIEDMWENFSVDDYAPRSKMRQRSNSLGSTPTKQKESSQQREWKHRITIPKPFKMTERENSVERKKSRVIEEYELQREMKAMAEEAECQKKFKAAPVPAHVYVPLYDEIMEEQELRRRQNRELAKELMRSIEKPFKFLKREEEKQNNRQSKWQQVTPDATPKKKFKARPVPNYIYNDASILDKLEEEEEYRKIRVKMRAEEMLRSSSLPPNMQARARSYTDGAARQKMYLERAKKAGFTNEHKFRPKIKGDVPDFDELYDKFHNQLNRKKTEKEATVCKPFNLRTSRIPSKKDRIYQDIDNDELNLKESRWPFRTGRAKPTVGRSLEFSGSPSTSLDCIPAKMTTATELRSSANRKKKKVPTATLR